MKQPLSNDHSSSEYVESMKEDTFKTIYKTYWKDLYDFVTVKVRDRNVAEEIVQDLFVTLWEKRHHLHIRNIRAYLFISVRNRIIDYYKERIFTDIEKICDAPSPGYPLFLEELEETVQTAMGQLPDKTREIFVLNRLDGKSASEISAQLHLPQRTVEYHITKALRQLRVSLEMLNSP